MNRFDLRSARTTDAGKTGAILSEFIDTTPWMPRIHTRAEDVMFAGTMIERGWVTVAQDAGRVVGFCARDDRTIHALYVSEGVRSQGCGAALLQRAQSECTSLQLWTFQANPRAQAFYLRHGFAEAERTDGSGNDESLPDIRYIWERETR